MKLAITGQSISWENSSLAVSGSDGIYSVEFEFTDASGLPSWDDLTRYAVFKNSGVPGYYEGVIIPIENGRAVIPAQILAEQGKLYVGVYGENGYYKMPTIWAPPVVVSAGCVGGSDAVEAVLSSAQNAIKAGENAQVWAEGGYVVTQVEGTSGDPQLVRQAEYTKGAKQYALEAAEDAEAAGAAAVDALAAKDAAETAKALAEDAQAGAEEAYGAAETAQASAESAKLAAENAQTSAETAQLSAEGSASSAAASAQSASGSASAAAGSASGAASSKAAAETAQTKAEAAQAAAEDAKGDAETAKTAAETAQQSAAGSASSAAAAKTAAETAQSAAEAAKQSAEAYKDQAAEYAAAAQSVVDSNFLLVDKDDNDKKYLVMMYVEDGDFCVDFEDFAG